MIKCSFSISSGMEKDQRVFFRKNNNSIADENLIDV